MAHGARAVAGALALKAGVHKASLSRWEAGRYQPSLTELDAVLDALQAPPAQRRRALHRINAPRAVRRLQETDANPPPAIGDLLRAMRLHRGLTQSEAAARIGVRQNLLSRWEHCEARPGPERLRAFGAALGAHEAEMRALTCGRMALPSGSVAALSREEFHDRLNRLQYPSDPVQAALSDLGFLCVEAELWSLSASRPSARAFLAETYARHARFLAERDRCREARTYVERSLALKAEGCFWDERWLDAVIARAMVAARGGRRSQEVVAAGLLHTRRPGRRGGRSTARGCAASKPCTSPVWVRPKGRCD